MTAEVSFDPRTGSAASSIAHTTPTEIDEVVAAAARASEILASAAPQERRRWLYAVADALEASRKELARVADWETALGTDRLGGEIARTAGQLRFYADVAVDGAFLGAVMDDATSTTPALARVNVPLGPLAVFGASNFPFAFSVLGNDTASGLAAGCAVVVKAHPAHPLLSRSVFDLAATALADAGAPEGVLGIVFGHEAGVALVQHPLIAAVGFTGSQAGGTALWRLANERPVVIPVYAEMGTVNPAVVTGAAAAAIATIAAGFAESFTLGSGQFCTKPGLVFVPRGAGALEAITEALAELAPEPVMLTKGISESVIHDVAALQAAGATVVAEHSAVGTGWSAPAVLLTAPLSAIHAGSPLLEEVFGPVAVVVEYDLLENALGAVDALQGALAASMLIAENDPDAAELLEHLQRKVGRVIVNQWPTGVAVTWAQQHGGPWPATSSPSTTSVGAAALDRFVRPIAYQGFPDELLPPPLQAGNPWRMPRRVNGTMVSSAPA